MDMDKDQLLSFSIRYKISAVLTGIVLLFFSMAYISGASDSQRTDFKRISTDFGLSNSSATCFIQDKQGFLWVGTKNGLNRYDSFDFKIYKNIFADSTSIGGNSITALLYDGYRKILIGTENYGFSIFNKVSKKFSQFNSKTKGKGSGYPDKITALSIGEGSDVWIGTRGEGLYLFNLKKETIEIYKHGNTDIGKLKNMIINDLVFDHKNKDLWLGTQNNGIVRIGNKVNSKNNYKVGNIDPNSFKRTGIRKIMIDSSGILWSGTEDGLYRFDEINDIFIRFAINISNGSNINDVKINDLFQDSAGFIWIGTENEGLLKYDIKKGKYKQFKNEKNNKKSLSRNGVLSIYEDRSGLVWIGTKWGGICVYDRFKDNFSNISNDSNGQFNRKNGIVQALADGGDNQIWVGSDTGLENLDLKTGRTITYFNDGQAGLINGEINVNSIFNDPDSGLWIGTKQNGLINFGPDTGKMLFYRNNSQIPGSISQNFITAVQKTRNGDLWVGTFSKGLNLLKKGQTEFKHYLFDKNKQFSLSNNNILVIFEDKNENLWIGTSGSGLNRYDKSSGQFISYIPDPKKKNSIGSAVIYAICEDIKGNLWIGGKGGGLNLFDREDKTFKRYTDADYISRDEIYNINVDSSGSVWFGSDKRIGRFDPVKSTFFYFDTSYWFNDNRLVSQSSIKKRDGTLLYGGRMGVSSFIPKEISFKTSIPNLLINSVSTIKRTITPFHPEKTGDRKTNILPYAENDVKFIFGIIDFRNLYVSRYKYLLEGNDEIWEKSDNLSYLFYDDLAPGDYTFLVDAADHYGSWNKDRVSFRFTVKTPFWLSVWFKIMLFLIGLGILTGFFKWRLYKIKYKKQELENKILERTKALQLKQDELERVRESLELQVSQRTFELQKKNLELEQEIKEKQIAEEERQKLEKQLFEAQKMESIGRLAGGIAHDFNNILTAILGYAEILKKKYFGKDQKTSRAVEIILSNIFRARDLISQLLGFARRGKYNPVPINIKNTIKRIMKVSEKILNKKIIVNYDFKEDTLPCLADRAQLDQVISNLIINASEAMNENGILTFSAENVIVDENSKLEYPGLRPGSYVKFSVSDNGIGIPENLIDKVFEPFVSTKKKGSGLGLSTVYGIIKNHDGYINISSEESVGTTVMICLPATKNTVVDITETSGIMLGKGTVLIADDEPNILSSLSEQLQSIGYEVMGAENGKEAVELFSKHHKDIDLVILDMIMPVMSGKESFYKIRSIDPDIKILLFSGFSKGTDGNELMESGANGFIQKPVSISILSKTIYELLL